MLLSILDARPCSPDQDKSFPSLLFTISHSSYAMNVSAIKVITFLPVFQKILSQHLIFSFPVPLILQSNCLHNYRFSLRLSPITSKEHITVSMMLVSSTFTPHTIHEPNPNIMKQNRISSWKVHLLECFLSQFYF